MFDFEKLMRYRDACVNYRGGHDRPSLQAQMEVLGDRWWKVGLWQQCEDQTLPWLYKQFSPEQLAPMYWECNHASPYDLLFAREDLRYSIDLIVRHPDLAAMALPEDKWEIDGIRVGVIYPDKFYAQLPGKYGSTLNLHIPTDGTHCWAIDNPDVKYASLEEAVREIRQRIEG